jgi:hypothetical protein
LAFKLFCRQSGLPGGKMQLLITQLKGAFTPSSKVPSLIDEFARRANSSSKKADFAALLGEKLVK